MLDVEMAWGLVSVVGLRSDVELVEEVEEEEKVVGEVAGCRDIEGVGRVAVSCIQAVILEQSLVVDRRLDIL